MKPTAQEILAGMALMFMGCIGLSLLYETAPAANHDYLLIILGALGGAMGVTGASRAVSAISTMGAGTTVNSGSDSAPLGESK